MMTENSKACTMLSCTGQVCLVVSIHFLTIVSSNEKVFCDSERKCRCIRAADGIEADCSNLRLQKSPKFANNVISVDLSRNYLTFMPNNDQLPKTVRYIDLSRNLISNFSMDGQTVSFSGLINLETLNLSSNFIELSERVYFKNIFINFTNLRVFDISNNTQRVNISLIPSQHLSDVFRQIISLEYLAFDGLQNISFLQGFATLKKLKSLKIAGLCNNNRLTVINENYFENFPYLEFLDISGPVDWILDKIDGAHCSVYNIYRGAIAKMNNLKYLDVSYNRVLGLCGFRNITHDLLSTKITHLKTSFLQCEGGTSSTLFCDDIKYLKHTKLKEFYFDGNNIAFAEPNILTHLPESLEVISLKSNRWEDSSIYTYSGMLLNVNLKSVDMSNLNEHQMSHTTNYQYCANFVREINCEKYRASSLGNSSTPQQNHWCPQPNDTSPMEINTISTERRLFYFTNLTTCDIPSDYMDYEIEFITLPPNIINITMNNSRLGQELIITFFNTKTIKRLVLSNNQFYTMTGPICNGPNIEYLDLSGNRCSEFSTYLFRYVSSLKTLLLNDNLFGNSKIINDNKIGDIFANQSSLMHLDLASNRIAFLPKNIFWNLTKLEVLILKNNLLVDFNCEIKHMKRLKFLDISQNQILFLSNTSMKRLDDIWSPDILVDFSQNPFQCVCDSVPFVNWLIQKGMLNYNCTFRNAILHIQEGKRHLDIYCTHHTILIVTSLCCVIVILALVIAVLVYRHRWKLRYWYYIAKRKYSRGYQSVYDTDEYQFDAFISYADDDRSFVIKNMIPELEEQNNFRLCIHHRDFIPGCDIADNIINAIHHSRKVIFIITNSFLESSWCLYEVNIAHTEYTLSRQGQNMMIIIFKENITRNDLPNRLLEIIAEETYVEFPTTEQNEAGFWVQLVESFNT